MAHSKAFRDLMVWQRSMALVQRIYEISAAFPRDERFGLTAQIRRAAVSVPPNIGEGSRRKRRKTFLNHLDIALGSQAEVEVQLEIAQRLRFVKMADYKQTQIAVEEIGRMLNGLIVSLQPDGDAEL
ncbi:MAG TPA: four helix bundle protein [Vicinamibacterales bacterium]|nr:four helix bundle protein [Vicinamibacterales bacterium]